MRIFEYNRDLAVDYALKWALNRNTKYYNFDKLGGDCTNFISQCVFNGCKIMNPYPVLGWYYNTVNSRTPAWTGVEFLYNFLTANLKGVGDTSGPFGKTIEKSKLETGDIIQLSFDGVKFTHSLIVTGFNNGVPLICTHTNDALNKKLTDYRYKNIRFIKILGFRK